ncbi:L-serine ammonia-lyase, iron-sulfur-dependent, subunit alpha [Miniphocaeibacter massiliensis]|uniref:L-serine ammonia-lyase, iron-sulfur-dependent, subunit alpha n=1 Tax=Miniphocaeibacter massiliensis TaxID=2041841 RepID=UPI000C077400|nr:L-serine ammonia-lyase, iron-sulfur-dependent, subunit alpha [Miniphocaeibacter massiliensis]
MTLSLYPDLFNDVFGPIMQPGSSSHTAAPCRMGYLCNSILGEKPVEITIQMDTEGSFVGTFGSMNEDLGMLAGALGFLPDDSRLFDVKEICKKEGINYKFDFCEMKESPHLNSLKFILKSKSGKESSIVANSIGGGMIETVLVNGYPFQGQGDTYVVLIFDENGEINHRELELKLQNIDIFESGLNTSSEKVLHWFKTSDKPKGIENILNEYDFAIMKPILPVATRKEKKPALFDSMTKWIELAKEQNVGLAEIAIQYEINSSGWNREEILNYMEKVRKYMHRQTHAIYEEDVIVREFSFTGNKYKEWSEYSENKNPLCGNVITLALKYAYAAQAAIPGIPFVPGPMGTGGGFVYAVLSAVQELNGYKKDDLIRALFVAAGVGAISYARTNPTGEVIGCAGECGVCMSMAAAGLSEMIGSTPEQIEASASLAMQSAIGWPCDTIPGGFWQPCGSRVTTTVAMAITFAELARANTDPVLPYHEVIDVADEIGRSMDRGLLCTAGGGHCNAPTAQKYICEFKEWHKNQI